MFFLLLLQLLRQHLIWVSSWGGRNALHFDSIAWRKRTSGNLASIALASSVRCPRIGGRDIVDSVVPSALIAHFDVWSGLNSLEVTLNLLRAHCLMLRSELPLGLLVWNWVQELFLTVMHIVDVIHNVRELLHHNDRIYTTWFLELDIEAFFRKLLSHAAESPVVLYPEAPSSLFYIVFFIGVWKFISIPALMFAVRSLRMSWWAADISQIEFARWYFPCVTSTLLMELLLWSQSIVVWQGLQSTLDQDVAVSRITPIQSLLSTCKSRARPWMLRLRPFFLSFSLHVLFIYHWTLPLLFNWSFLIDQLLLGRYFLVCWLVPFMCSQFGVNEVIGLDWGLDGRILLLSDVFLDELISCV